jgi:hypothetical protein
MVLISRAGYALTVRWDVLKDKEHGDSLECFVSQDQPSEAGGGDHGQGGTSHWVRSSIIALFVLMGVNLAILLAVAFMVRSAKRHGYERL